MLQVSNLLSGPVSRDTSIAKSFLSVLGASVSPTHSTTRKSTVSAANSLSILFCQNVLYWPDSNGLICKAIGNPHPGTLRNATYQQIRLAQTRLLGYHISIATWAYGLSVSDDWPTSTILWYEGRDSNPQAQRREILSNARFLRHSAKVSCVYRSTTLALFGATLFIYLQIAVRLTVIEQWHSKSKTTKHSAQTLSELFTYRYLVSFSRQRQMTYCCLIVL